MATTKLFIPETSPIIIEPSHGMWLARPWLSLMREIVRLLSRINLTGIVGGIVVTDDEGTATVISGQMAPVLYSAGDYTADTGTWTVAMGDVVVWAWLRLGHQVFLSFEVATTSVSATPTELRVVLPGGSIAAYSTSTLFDGSDNGTPAVLVGHTDALGTTLTFTRQDGAAFATSVNTTSVRGTMIVEVQ